MTAIKPGNSDFAIIGGADAGRTWNISDTYETVVIEFRHAVARNCLNHMK
jgi:hypothetical protein